MASLSLADLERAVAQLNRSEKGQQAMRDLLAFLENGALSLDSSNQLACLCLLSGAWGSYAGTVRHAMQVMLHPVIDTPLEQVETVAPASP